MTAHLHLSYAATRSQAVVGTEPTGKSADIYNSKHDKLVSFGKGFEIRVTMAGAE